MNCQEFIDFLMAYIEEELPAEERKVFEDHIKLCPPCGEYLRSYEQCIKLGQAACQCESEDVPAEVPEGLVQAILASRRKSH